MTNEDILKCLRTCVDESLACEEGCSLGPNAGRCRTILMKEAVDLIENLNKVLQVHNNDLSLIKEDRDKKISSILILEAKNLELIKENEKIKDEYAALSKQYDGVAAQLDDMHEKLDTYKRNNYFRIEVIDDNNRLKDALRKLREETDKLQGEYNALKRYYEIDEQELIDQREEINKLKKELITAEQESLRFKTAIQTLLSLAVPEKYKEEKEEK